jgi:hypothetical protein
VLLHPQREEEQREHRPANFILQSKANVQSEVPELNFHWIFFFSEDGTTNGTPVTPIESVRRVLDLFHTSIPHTVGRRRKMEGWTNKQQQTTILKQQF